MKYNEMRQRCSSDENSLQSIRVFLYIYIQIYLADVCSPSVEEWAGMGDIDGVVEVYADALHYTSHLIDHLSSNRT